MMFFSRTPLPFLGLAAVLPFFTAAYGNEIAGNRSLDTAAEAMTLPDGFSSVLIAGEPDIIQPIAYTIDSRGRIWVLENRSYPHSPGENENQILIFEDTNTDGAFDKRTVFFDELPFASGIIVGFGGVWIGSPPNLLFFPFADENQDSPDGPAEVVLDGWGAQDTHETLNNFIWGPDGWLYGCHGVFTHSRVGKPGTPDEDRVPFNAAIWRYHPVTEEFELFIEGVSNQWGMDFDDYGQSFFTACVIPHAWHAILGGRYHRQSGSHFNPYTYDDLKTIADHIHQAAAYSGAMIYLGDQFPDEYRNTLFMNNIHSNRMHRDVLARKGSGFVCSADDDFITFNDAWFRGLSPQYGPDGSLFVNDWHEHVPCHQQRDQIHRDSGRLYRVSYGNAEPVSVDIEALSNEELVEMQLHKNDWYVRHARRILQERGADPEVHQALEEILRENPDETRKLRAMWALHVTEGFTEELALELLESPLEYVRSWSIQLITEDRQASSALRDEFARLSREDPSPVVRLYLASALQRLPNGERWEIAEGLVSHAEDSEDHNLPLMIWYGIEPAVPEDAERAVNLAEGSEIPLVRQYITRRLAEDS